MTMVWVAVWFSGFSISAADADIYSWTDENGVNHFTNYAPPKQARLLMKTPEIPYDKEADIQRQENDRLEVARLELAEREAYLLQQQQEAERRIAEANARADAALQEADQILQDAEAAAEDANYVRNGSYVNGYGYYYNGYYRKYGHYYKKRHYKYRLGRHNKYGYRHGHKYYFKSRHRKHGLKRRHGLSRGRGFSHHSRAAAFRGRHGRY
jgi:hypothetical protein